MKITHVNYVFVVAVVGNLLALTGDTSLTWSSPVLPKLYSNDRTVNPLGKPITPDEESWIGSMQYIGAMCGILPFSLLAANIGRKRFLGGVSLSSVYIVLPMYVAEISEDSYRGTLLVTYSTFASFGDLLPYIVGPYISMLWFNVILSVSPLVFFILFAYLAPESPYFYVGKNDFEAKKCLSTLRQAKPTYDVDVEIERIKYEINKNQKGDFWNTIKRKYVMKGFTVALGLCIFQQLSGLTAILAYTQNIFDDADTNFSPEISSIIVGTVLFLASFGGPFIVDKRGRKFLLVCSSIGIITSESVLGLYFYLKDRTTVSVENISWLPVVCLMVYVITFNIGYGPLPHTITSEILPSNVKFHLATITGFSGWLMSFLVTKFFGVLNEALGTCGTFWLFSVICVFGLLFIITVVPETKGKSFQEIQVILDK